MKSYDSSGTSLWVVERGIELSCRNSDSECVHVLVTESFSDYVARIGVETGEGAIAATEAAVIAGRAPVVSEVIHDLAPATFVWYDSDSDFYNYTGE